jgi:hypothetical protein
MDDDDQMETIKNRYAATHPVVISFGLPGTLWDRFRDITDEGMVAKVLEAKPQGRLVQVTLACLDHDVADRLEDGWGS